MNELGINHKDGANMIIKYVYEKHKNQKKSLLWDILGEEIINNIRNNIKLQLDNPKVKMCECCGKRFELKTNNSPQIYCNKCSKKIKASQNKKSYEKLRKK